MRIESDGVPSSSQIESLNHCCKLRKLRDFEESYDSYDRVDHRYESQAYYSEESKNILPLKSAKDQISSFKSKVGLWSLKENSHQTGEVVLKKELIEKRKEYHSPK